MLHYYLSNGLHVVHYTRVTHVFIDACKHYRHCVFCFSVSVLSVPIQVCARHVVITDQVYLLTTNTLPNACYNVPLQFEGKPFPITNAIKHHRSRLPIPSDLSRYHCLGPVHTRRYPYVQKSEVFVNRNTPYLPAKLGMLVPI